MAHLAALPPFEGYDETAHWSSLQQIADEGHIPRYGQDHLSADLSHYPGPWAAPEGQPFQEWFAHPASGAPGPTHFSQGRALNWQAQHPPLYYVLLALVYRLGHGLDWRHHLFLLRLASWSLAFAGFAWGALRTQSLLRVCGINDTRLLIPLAWPFLFPEFFPEFARLTNDALVMLLAAGLWSVTLNAVTETLSKRRAVALGPLLGAGLLTKAFFLPLAVSVFALLTFSAYRQPTTRGFWVGIAIIGVCASPSVAWYAHTLQVTGTVSGGNDFVHLQQAGGLWSGLRAHFSLLHYAIGAVRILAQFAWAGTWSFVHPNRWLVAPIAASLVIGVSFYLATPRLHDPLRVAPLFFVVPFFAGLLFHLLAMVAATGEGMGTPGWYLHILAAPLSMALAIGWRWPRIQGALAAYAVLFGAAMVPWQLAFFSGCLNRSGAGGGTLAGAVCLIDLRHLQAVSLPALSFTALAFGLSALTAAVTLPILRPR